nr:MAG: DUF2125 domain-containing protein [Hyphomicrobiales bacterium]
MIISKRLLTYGPLAVLLLLALAYALYWFVIASRITAELERLGGNEIVPGITLQFAEKSVGGFPFRFDIFLGGVTIAAQGQAGMSAWRSERIAVHAKIYGPRQYILEADGLQTFSWPADGGAPQHILQMTSGITRAGAVLENERLTRFDIDIVNAVIRDASLDAAPMREIRIARAQLQMVVREDDAIGVVAAIDAGEIGAGFRPALGGNLSRLRIDGQITDANTLHDLRSGNESLGEASDAWRMAGGRIILDPIEAAWGGTLLLGKSELALDNRHRLSGLVTANPEDPVSFLGALSQSEMIPANTRAQLAAFRELAAGLPGNLDLPIRVEAQLPLGAGPITPQLRIEGMSGIVVTFADGAPP